MVLRFIGIFIVSLLVSCGGSSTGPALENEVAEPLSGEVLYTNHCSSCHGVDGKLGASGAKDLSTSTMNENEMVDLLKTGRKAMPVMKEILQTEENMHSVSKFVIEFQK